MPQAGEPAGGASEGRAASQSVSAEFRRTAASSSAVGWTAQARHVLRSWTVGSSWTSPRASQPGRPAVGLTGQQPEQRPAGLALVLRRRVELRQLARQPFGSPGCWSHGPAARAARRGPGACPPPSSRAGPACPSVVRPTNCRHARASSPSSASRAWRLSSAVGVELGQPARQPLGPLAAGHDGPAARAAPRGPGACPPPSGRELDQPTRQPLGHLAVGHDGPAARAARRGPGACPPPSGRAAPARAPAARPPSGGSDGPAARAAPRGPGACPPPSGRAGPARPPAARPPRCRSHGPAARAAPRGPGACPPPSGRAAPARPPAIRPPAAGLTGQQPEQRVAGLALVLRRRRELGQPVR